MKGRDRTREIIEIKQRDSLWKGHGPHALKQLREEWYRIRDSDACRPDFYVIRSVTLLEVFARANIAGLIDHGGQFTDRAIELSKHVKIDFELVRAIQGRTITLGDILAHSVPVNSFGQMYGYFENLLGEPLRPVLESVVDRWETEVEKKPVKPIIGDYDNVARSLTRLFEVRHIVCHEAPRESVYKRDEIDQFLESAIQFANALDWVLAFEKFGLVPLTQTDMNIASHNDLKKAEDLMGQLLSEIEIRIDNVDRERSTHKGVDTDDSWLGHLRNAQEKWLSYRKAHCEFETYLNRGGTIRPTLWAGEARRLTDLRIADLQSWLERDSQR